MDLPPGAYTAIVTDVSGASGIALIELLRHRSEIGVTPEWRRLTWRGRVR
jgi:hypothetical protein